ncbi:hypothetical protein Tco_0088571 [Tanacetum coccineum]
MEDVNPSSLTFRDELFYSKKKLEFNLWFENDGSVDSLVGSDDEIEEEFEEEVEEIEEDDLEYFDIFLTIEALGFKHIDIEDLKTDNIPPFIIASNDDERNDSGHEKTYYSDCLNIGAEYKQDESVTKAIQCLIKMKSRTIEGVNKECDSESS